QARTFGRAAPEPLPNPTLIEWIALLRRYFDQFVKTANTVIANPHSTLARVLCPVEPGRARRVSEHALERRFRRPLPRIGGRLSSGLELPARVPEIRRQTTFDNPENRYFKYVLFETLRKLQEIALTTETGDEDAELSAEQRFFAALRPEAFKMISKVQG